MKNCNPVSTPMEPGAKLSKYDEGERVDANRYQSLVGSLRYLTCTRAYLSLSVGIISWFMEESIYSHWKALKRVLRYIQQTVQLGLFYSKAEDYKLVGYFDSDWCGDIDDPKSTSGYVSSWATQYLLGFQRNNRSWHSRCVKLSIWQHLGVCVTRYDLEICWERWS